MINNDTFSIKSELSEVRVLAKHFCNFCKLHNIDDDILGLLELCLVEAINNIIIHAYNEEPDLIINAEYEISHFEIIIKLTDFGKIFHQEPKHNKNTRNNELAEGSWGLSLIQNIADEVDRKRENNSNILIIKKTINI